jgi:uncharacterized protein YbjT (DUF2867 family)
VRSARKLERRHWAQRQDCTLIEGGIDIDGINDRDGGGGGGGGGDGNGDGDRRSVDALAEKMAGCDVAYYLVHSMIAAGADYAKRDRDMAQTFARAAAKANVSRIIYLGGLGEIGDGLSDHLKSRREVEQALATGGVPVTVLRAAMIIGSGSASFEILRYLVERLPVMITPRWVSTECQPVAIDNVLDYLQLCLTTPETTGRTLDIGGPDVLTYRRLIDIVARQLRLPARVIIPVPVLTPRLSSLWIHLVTPLSAKIARPLAEGLKNRVVCRNDDAARLMPQNLLGVEQAIALAFEQRGRGDTETSWTMAGELRGDPDWAGGKTFTDSREIDISATPAAVFSAVCSLGGEHGWYSGSWLWRLRGALDRLVGGPGLRRGRRDPRHLFYGEALDFWRVTELQRDRLLRLSAEMKLPGHAELAFALTPGPEGSTRLSQTARFRPRGLLGLAYWYAVLPFHGFVFNQLLRGLKASAEARR